MDRRDFLAKAGLLATWAAIPVTIAACGDDDNPAGPGNGDGNVDGSVEFSDGHSHTVSITGAQVDAGAAVTLQLSNSGHVHSVSLAAEQVVDIGDGIQVTAPTNPDGTGHVHDCTFN